jgi:hypothetical protein
MSKVKTSGSSSRIEKNRVKRKGVHSKTKTSNSKNSVNYVKKYRGQGK